MMNKISEYQRYQVGPPFVVRTKRLNDAQLVQKGNKVIHLKIRLNKKTFFQTSLALLPRFGDPP